MDYEEIITKLSYNYWIKRNGNASVTVKNSRGQFTIYNGWGKSDKIYIAKTKGFKRTSAVIAIEQAFNGVSINEFIFT